MPDELSPCPCARYEQIIIARVPREVREGRALVERSESLARADEVDGGAFARP
jgi:hypothetical protein